MTVNEILCRYWVYPYTEHHYIPTPGGPRFRLRLDSEEDEVLIVTVERRVSVVSVPDEELKYL